MTSGEEGLWKGALLVAGAAALAWFSARPDAGSWNDGSRLATVECLVDYHTWVIDRSIFARPCDPAGPVPYQTAEPHLNLAGTQDKLYIRGHFYSDKSPVPALWLAGVYQLLKTTTALTAATNPGRFCFWMTLASSGLAFVAAVGCLFRMAGNWGLSPIGRIGLTLSFGLATVAPVYAACVNNHLLLLAVTAAMLALLPAEEDQSWGMPRLVGIGLLAGLGYSIDLGVGPVLLFCTLVLVAFRCRRPGSVAVFALSALPLFLLHHGLNYAIGGTWKPANAVPEYFQWPGCPFNQQNMTGAWHHTNVGHFVEYALALLVGKRGFLGHNLPLFLLVPAAAWLAKEKFQRKPECVYAASLCLGTWLIYAVTSTNYSGQCCSIRWFVPLLAPAFWVIGVYLRRNPGAWPALAILTAWGAIEAGIMAWKGPWMAKMVPYYWFWQAGALGSLLGWYYCRQQPGIGAAVESKPKKQAA